MLFVTLAVSFEILRLLVTFNVALEMETHLTKEMGTFHYGWFCNLSVDFNKSKESVKINPVFFSNFGGSVLSATEIGEIRNQINYMLESEDDADEEFFENFADPFSVETDDPFEIDYGDPFYIDYGDSLFDSE